jgi:hypothetical protein
MSPEWTKRRETVLTTNLKSNTMNYQEYMQTNFVKSMTESLSPITGKGMARYFFMKIYQELQAQDVKT